MHEVISITSHRVNALSSPASKLPSKLLSRIFLFGSRAEESRISALDESRRGEHLEKEYVYDREYILKPFADVRSVRELTNFKPDVGHCKRYDVAFPPLRCRFEALSLRIGRHNQQLGQVPPLVRAHK